MRCVASTLLPLRDEIEKMAFILYSGKASVAGSNDQHVYVDVGALYIPKQAAVHVAVAGVRIGGNKFD